MKNKKNTNTNVVALAFAVLSGIQIYLGTIPEGATINWLPLFTTILGSIIAWYTGKPT